MMRSFLSGTAVGLLLGFTLSAGAQQSLPARTTRRFDSRRMTRRSGERDSRRYMEVDEVARVALGLVVLCAWMGAAPASAQDRFILWYKDYVFTDEGLSMPQNAGIEQPYDLEDPADVEAFQAMYCPSVTCQGDLSGDGTVGAPDYSILQSQWGEVCEE